MSLFLLPHFQIRLLLSNRGIFGVTPEHVVMDKHKLHHFKAKVLIVTEATESLDVPYLCHLCSPLARCPFTQRDLRGVLAHTNIIKAGLQGNMGHLVHQNTTCQSNMDYKVSYETANIGQGGYI